MTVGEFAKNGGFEIAAGGESLSGEPLEREITGGFCGDLLSWVMGRAASGDVWVTVMGNTNAVAVALLADVACLILAQNAELDEDAKKRADENNIAVLKSGESAFDISVMVAKVLEQ
jgi:predicted transcriptional regulator